MLSGTHKTIILSVMWFSMGLVAVAAADYSGNFLSIFMPLFVAVMITVVFAMLPAEGGFAQLGKAKRKPVESPDKMALLMDLMDEDERAAFKAVLKARMIDRLSTAGDGELPLDAGLMAEFMGDDDAVRSGHSQ